MPICFLEREVKDGWGGKEDLEGNVRGEIVIRICYIYFQKKKRKLNQVMDRAQVKLLKIGAWIWSAYVNVRLGKNQFRNDPKMALRNSD